MCVSFLLWGGRVLNRIISGLEIQVGEMHTEHLPKLYKVGPFQL